MLLQIQVVELLIQRGCNVTIGDKDAIAGMCKVPWDTVGAQELLMLSPLLVSIAVVS